VPVLGYPRDGGALVNISCRRGELMGWDLPVISRNKAVSASRESNCRHGLADQILRKTSLIYINP
jgi:hypothetical protein